MRKPLLLALALVAMPTLAFEQAQVMQPAALANVRDLHVLPVALELPAAARRYERSSDAPRPVAPRDAEAKAADLTAALRRGFAKDFNVVDAPGPGVLVVEATHTRLEASRPTMADYHREPGLGFESVYAGGAAFNVRLSRDGNEIAVLKDRYVGNFGDGTPRIGIWQDTDRAFSRWSRQLPNWVAQPETAAR